MSNFPKAITIAIIIAIIVAALPTGPILIYAQHQVNFVANLTGKNMVPPVDTAATGTAKFHVNPNGTLSYELDVKHINQVIGVPIRFKDGTNLADLLDVYSTPSSGTANRVLVSGLLTANKLNGPLRYEESNSGGDATALTSFLTNESVYVTVRTTQHQQGEIQGQILPSLATGTNATTANAPETIKTAGTNATTENAPVPQTNNSENPVNWAVRIGIIFLSLCLAAYFAQMNRQMPRWREYIDFKKRIRKLYKMSYQDKQESLRKLNEIRMEVAETYLLRYDITSIEIGDTHYYRNLILLDILRSLSYIVYPIFRTDYLFTKRVRNMQYEGLNRKISKSIQRINNRT